MNTEKEIVRYNFAYIHSNITTLHIDKTKRHRDIHFHNEAELILTLTGNAVLEIDGKKIVLNEGDSVYVGSNVLHSLKVSEQPADVLLIQTSAECMHDFDILPAENEHLRLFLERNDVKPYFVFSEKDNPFSEVLYKIQSEFTSNQPYLDRFIKAYIEQLSAILLRSGVVSDHYLSDKQADLKKLMPIISYISENYQKKITLDDLCEVSNFSKFYLCKLFKKNLGVSTTEYINFVRCAIAERQILNSDKNISEIVYEIGFASTQYFNRMFKLYYGYTPTAYKRMLRN